MTAEYILRFMESVYPGSAQLALSSFNEQKALEDATATINDLRSKLEAFTTAVDWVLNDAAYKPPEEIGDVAERWISCLRDAKESP